MRMNQDERRFDFHGLGAALKRAREEKGWTQAYVAELVDRDSRTIMNIENKGQYPSFDLFVKLITMFDVSVDQTADSCIYIQFKNLAISESSVQNFFILNCTGPEQPVYPFFPAPAYFNPAS